MRNRAAFILPSVLCLALAASWSAAQTPTPTPTPGDDGSQPSTPARENASGPYTIISGIEIGVRGLSVDGDRDKYRADLNYHPGFRLFDSSFLVRANDGDGPLFDTLVVNSSGWNADPHGSLRVNAQNGRWYRFDLNYRRNRYVNRLVTLVRGEHTLNTAHNLGDFDLRLLPTNRRIRFNLGASFDRNTSVEPGLTTYNYQRDEFRIRQDFRTRAEEYRGGVEGSVGPLNLGLQVGRRGYRDDSTYFITETEPGRPNAAARLDTFERNFPNHGRAWFTRLSAHSNIARKVDVNTRYTYSNARNDFLISDVITGINANNQRIERNVSEFSGRAERPAHLFDFTLVWRVTPKLRVSDIVRYNTFRNEGDHVFSDVNFLRNATTGAQINPFPSTVTVPIARVLDYRRVHNQIKVDYQFGPRLSLHAGHRISDRHIEIERRGRILPTPVSAAFSDEEEVDTTNNSFFGGFRARPVKRWTVYFDFERGEADNTFTRLDNLDAVSFRVRTRFTPARGLGLGLSFVSRDNSDPGVGVVDRTIFGNFDSTPFSVEIDRRTFDANLDWSPDGGRYTFAAGFTYNYLHSDAEILYFPCAGAPSGVPCAGRSLYDIRDSFFYFHTSAQLTRWLSGYAGYRVHRDSGSDIITDVPAGLFARSIPLRFQTPEVRLIFRLDRRLDWNVGYQYYEYRERLATAQNYRAHMPYTSLRFYFGGADR